MNNNYIIHTAIKCSDGKVHRLSYDLLGDEVTECSVRAFGRVFKEIEKRFPDVNFWIQQYPENKTGDDGDFSDFKYIHGEPPIFNNEIQTMKSE